MFIAQVIYLPGRIRTRPGGAQMHGLELIIVAYCEGEDDTPVLQCLKQTQLLRTLTLRLGLLPLQH